MVALALLGAALFPQDGKKDPPRVDEVKVDQAIGRGIEFLKATGASPSAPQEIPNSDELFLWTFVHAGVPENAPRFQELLFLRRATRPLVEPVDSSRKR